MDRKLKERIIGLVVLLTIAVLFLPMMLGGPDDSERSVRLDRPNAHEQGQEATDDRDLPVTRMDLREEEASETETPPDDDLFRPQPREEADEVEETSEEEEAAQARGLDQEPREPEPAPSEVDAADAQPEASESEPEPEPEPDPEPQEESLDEIPSGSGWAAQVGSFADRDNAEGLVSDLREVGFQSFLMRYESESRVLYRVRVGLEPDRDGAQALADRIREQTGHEAAPVPHP